MDTDILQRLRGLDVKTANIDFSLIVVINGIGATLLGGWIGDRLLKRYFGAYYTFSGVAMLIAVPFMVAAIYTRGRLMFPAIFAAVFFILIGTGPTNAALVNSVSASIRSTALAVNVFVIHLLGDAFSPTLIGRISDKAGSLQIAFWVAFVAAGISGVILLYGARFAPRFKAEEIQGGASMIWFYWIYWISGLLLAAIWLVPTLQLALHFSEVADLTKPEWEPPLDAALPSLTIVVPARNEEAEIELALRSLLQLNYPQFEIVAINDRSTDQTGPIMDRLAAEPERKADCAFFMCRSCLQAGWASCMPCGWVRRETPH